MPDVSVLVVNWNVRDLLRACLCSVLADFSHAGLEADVWVVDNASADDSAGMVRAEFPQVHLLASPENRGFAGGNNLALRQIARGVPPRYVWLLNPDTQVRPGALHTLVDFMDRHPRVGVAGARLFYSDGRFQHSAFGFPGLWQILFDLFPLPARLYDTRLNGRYPREWYERGKPFAIDHPLGAAMMVRWETTQDVGLFDEAFHMYCEEIDWCMRIRRAGWEIFCVPQAEVVHHEGQSTQQIRSASFVNLWRSRRRLYDKHYHPLKRWLARQWVRAGMERQLRATRQQAASGQLDEHEAAARLQAWVGGLDCFK
jgi:hypothetical protein